MTSTCSECGGTLLRLQTEVLTSAWECASCARRWSAAREPAREDAAPADVVPIRGARAPARFDVLLARPDSIEVRVHAPSGFTPAEARTLASALTHMAYVSETAAERAAGLNRWRFARDGDERTAQYGNPDPAGPRHWSFVRVALRRMTVRLGRHGQKARCLACREAIEPGPAYGARARLDGSESAWSDTSVRELRFCVTCAETETRPLARTRPGLRLVR